jgi:hypothetical protein
MEILIYEDRYCYYFFKPASMPSTFGKEKSFLDYLEEEKGEREKVKGKSEIIANSKFPVPISQFMLPETLVSNVDQVISNQIKIF